MTRIFRSEGRGTERPNVLLFVVDTTRAAETVPFDPAVTPNLAALAEDGTEYTRAFSVAPWTLPSHASLFTGTYPTRHGAHSDHTRLDGALPTLAEVFATAGYETAGVSNNVWVTEEFGLDEDTLVVHASDLGDFTGSHRQFNKGPLMYEDTYHIPLAVAGPSVSGAGRECDELVSLLDLMPTFLDVADLPVPEAVEGRSLLPLVEDRATGTREAVFAEYHGDEFGFYSQRMVRTDRYKYVFNAPDVDELYDLRADPHELRNLVDHPDYRSVGDRLRGRLVEWMTESGDPIRRWSVKHLGGE